MHIHHVIRGGLYLTGVGIGSIYITASAGAGSHGALTASRGERAAAAVPAPEPVVQEELLPVAPAAIPVLIEIPAVLPDVEAEPVQEPVSDIPVIQAGPGPATPVPGAITLIDPLVIERPAVDEGT